MDRRASLGSAAALSLYGGPVSTPHIERQARRGVTFQNATCPTAFCSPTEEGIAASDQTYDKILSASGYQTHQYGKWHLSGDDLSYYPDLYGEHRHYSPEMAAVFDEVRTRPRDEWMDWYGWALPVEVDPGYRKATAETR